MMEDMVWQLEHQEMLTRSEGLSVIDKDEVFSIITNESWLIIEVLSSFYAMFTNLLYLTVIKRSIIMEDMLGQLQHQENLICGKGLSLIDQDEVIPSITSESWLIIVDHRSAKFVLQDVHQPIIPHCDKDLYDDGRYVVKFATSREFNTRGGAQCNRPRGVHSEFYKRELVDHRSPQLVLRDLHHLVIPHRD